MASGNAIGTPKSISYPGSPFSLSISRSPLTLLPLGQPKIFLKASFILSHRPTPLSDKLDRSLFASTKEEPSDAPGLTASLSLPCQERPQSWLYFVCGARLPFWGRIFTSITFQPLLHCFVLLPRHNNLTRLDKTTFCVMEP